MDARSKTRTGMVDLTADWINIEDIAARIEKLESNTDPTERGVEECAQLESLLEKLRVPRGDLPWRDYICPGELIRDDAFTKYVRYLIDVAHRDDWLDYVVTDDSDSIDWEATALLERVFYASIKICGVTYWYLSGEREGEDHFLPRHFMWEQVLFH